MHFSIPDTKECIDENGSSYLTYNLQVNGWSHCSIRYRQLHSLHQQLAKDLHNWLPQFPPKRILPLNSVQTEERRQHLERYVLALSQEWRVLQNKHFNGFLAAAQHETFMGGGEVEGVNIQVYLMNGQRIVIPATDAMQTQNLLQLVCQQIGLPVELMNYFALFIIKKKDNELTVVKKLHNFECPYISLKSLRGSHRIVLRRNYWVSYRDFAIEDYLIQNPVALGLVYGQVVAEVQLGWLWISNDEVQQQLVQCQATGQKKEYLHLARTLKYYGYLHFSTCLSDFPSPNTTVEVSAGNNELSFRMSCEDGSTKEGQFKVTAMKCWRISTHQATEESTPSSPDSSHCISEATTSSSISPPPLKSNSSSFRQNSSTSTSSSGFSSSNSINDKSNLCCSSRRLSSTAVGDSAVLELSFEYLLSPGELGWVKLVSNQAVLMSLSVQGMVHQLMSSDSSEESIAAPRTAPVSDSAVEFTRKDGSRVLMYTHTTKQPKSHSLGLSALGELSFKRLTEKFTELNSGSYLHSTNATNDAISRENISNLQTVENSAFNVITDQHL